jgi:hypothetical protein
MSDAATLSRERLLARHAAAWAALLEPFADIDESTAGWAPSGEWSARDHLAHAAVWERHRLAVLRGDDPATAVGIAAAVWAAGDEDAMNALIAERWVRRPLPDVLAEVHAVRDALADALRTMPAERFSITYRALYPEDDDRGDGPVGNWAVGIAESHIDAHLAALRALLMRARGEEPPTVTYALRRFDAATAALMVALDTADPRAEHRCDEDGWSLADHVLHLAAWDRGMAALLRESPRAPAMGISAVDWAAGSVRINAVIRERGGGTALGDAVANLRENRAAFRDGIAALADEDFLRGYSAYDASALESAAPDTPPSFEFRPVFTWVARAGWEHADKHLPAMRALAHTTPSSGWRGR